MTGSANIWISSWTAGYRLTKPIRIIPENRDDFEMTQPESAHWAAVSSDYRSSSIKDPARLPKSLCGRKLDTTLRRLPDFFHGAGMYIISQKAADVFAQFDLGHGGCAQVTIFQGDRRNEVDDTKYYILYFGRCKQGFSTELSNMAAFSQLMYIRPGRQGYNALDVSDGDCVLSATTLEGCDLWIDACVGVAFFLSSRLVGAIKAAGLSGAMCLKSCRVADPV